MSRFSPRIIALFVLAGAPGALAAQAATGPTTPSRAVQEFMQALADSNLTRMGELFGNAKGPVSHTKPKDWQKKILLMQLFLHGVQARTLGEVPGKNGMQTVTTVLTNSGCKVTIPVDVAKSSRGWLVFNFDLEAAAKVNQPCETSKRPGNQ